MRVEVNHLTKRFGRFKALDRVTMEFGPGELIGVLGANGAGKTTLLRCLATILAPDEGDILIDGEPLRRNHLQKRRRIFILPDFPVFYGGWNLVRQITVILRLYGKDQEPGIQQKVVSLLEQFELLPICDAPIGALSRGQAYKGALVALFAIDPELWLLDEPFASGMDPFGISLFKKISREAIARGRTIIYTTQIMEVVEKFSTKACVFDRGELRAAGPVNELLTQAGESGAGLESVLSHLREQGA